jgi:hyperosmotically inducible protein
MHVFSGAALHRSRGWLLLAGASVLVWTAASAQDSQSHIAREVRHELLTLPYYGVFDNLTFRANGNIVTLLGQVTRPSLRSDAEKAVKQIEGVLSVDNQIEVIAPSREDDRIRLAVYTMTYGQPLLGQYALRAVPPVHILVKTGNVTLEGTVDSEMDKTMFFTEASGVPGVSSVTNHLKIAP